MPAATTTSIVMPRLSDSMGEGIIVRWLVADGDDIEAGQEIVEIETDKAMMPYEAEAAGRIQLLAAEGDAVPVGAVIAVIDGESAVAHARSGGNGSARVNASPVARRIAADLGIDLRTVAGTGPGGRIVKLDVGNASNRLEPEPVPPPSAPATARVPSRPLRRDDDDGDGGGKGDVTTRELSRSQQLVARRMSQSKATTPEFVLQAQVDMDAAGALRTQMRQQIGSDAALPSYNDFIVKACGVALRDHPLANGSYLDGRIELHSRVNVGFAVAAPGVVVVPTVFDADRKSLGEIAGIARSLAAKVREGRITPPELSGGTFSVSNLGMFGVDEFTAVINPPQAAILAVGAVKQRPVVHAGELSARLTTTIALTCDHRILYGADAAEFLARVKQLLEAPWALVL